MTTCIHCQSERIEHRKTIMQSGAICVAAYCLDCKRVATDSPWIAKARFTAVQLDAMPVENDYTGGALCQYRGCNAQAVEWNHYAPRYLFGDDCENYPIGPLCPEHHRTWHAGLEKMLMRKCPSCGVELHASAIVDAFNDPPAWSFWGEEGNRWIVCRDAGHVHFRVAVRGRMTHRLAVIRATKTAVASRTEVLER